MSTYDYGDYDEVSNKKDLLKWYCKFFGKVAYSHLTRLSKPLGKAHVIPNDKDFVVSLKYAKKYFGKYYRKQRKRTAQSYRALFVNKRSENINIYTVTSEEFDLIMATKTPAEIEALFLQSRML